MRLLEANDSVLCVIDVQPGFLDKLEPGRDQPLVRRIVWLAALAGALGVPVVATEEEPERNGATLDEVMARMPASAPRHTKPVFGLADVPEILALIDETGRRTAVLVGLETDVCVAHSALGLLDCGYRVAVVTDAVGAPGEAHDQGIERMRGAGAILLGTKGLHYEWARTVAGAWGLEEAMTGVPVPDGLVL